MAAPDLTPATGDAAADRRRFLGAALLGSLLALAIDVWMLAAGHPDLLRNAGFLGGLFDAQARALMHGGLAVDPASAGFEGFQIGGKTYLYFGPVPSILRIPALLFTHRLDGRLTQLSMLLALIVLLVAAARLHWRVRSMVCPGAPVGRVDSGLAFALALAVGAGGIALFLASWAVVYHEAELWGAALAVAAIDAVVAVVERPSTERIVFAGVLATLAVNTRVSVGLGPILALAALAAGLAAHMASGALRRDGHRRAARAAGALASFGPRAPGPRAPERARGGTLALLVAAALVPLLLSVAVNEVKFRQPFGFPIAQQVDSHIDPNRKTVLAANHDSLFSAKFVPTTLLQTIRPDALGTLRAFPFIGLPHAPPTDVGGVRFDTRQQSLSAPTSMPLLVLLTLAGLPALLLRRRLRPLLGIAAATALAYVPALTIAFVTTRYLADLLPFLVLCSLVGLHVLADAMRARGRLLLGGVALLALVGIATNGSAGLEIQRLLNTDTREQDRARFVSTQDSVDRFLGRRPRGVRASALLPAQTVGSLGDVFVLDRCAGMYVVGFGGWLPVERTERSGLHVLDVAFSAGVPAVPRALLTLGTGARRITVVAATAGMRTTVSVRLGGRTVATGSPVTLPADGHARVVVSIDPLFGGHYATVYVGRSTAAVAPVPYDRLAAAALGADPSDPRLARFDGTIAPVALRAPVCREIARRAEVVG